jgi:hypothetical protein
LKDEHPKFTLFKGWVPFSKVMKDQEL